MIKLLDILTTKYSGCERIYFSWDAASWHVSKLFLARVAAVNEVPYRKRYLTPEVKLAPLPARAQFLNVIESVFSGLATAIIHNSDYQSVEETKKAIDRYFVERNEHFHQHPRRAGTRSGGRNLSLVSSGKDRTASVEDGGSTFEESQTDLGRCLINAASSTGRGYRRCGFSSFR